jgi:hypothetical protein
VKHDLYVLRDGEDTAFFMPDPGDPGKVMLVAAAYAEGDQPDDPGRVEEHIARAFYAGAKRQPTMLVLDMDDVPHADPQDDEFDPWEALQDRFGQDYGWRAEPLLAFEAGGLDAVIALARRWHAEDYD